MSADLSATAQGGLRSTRRPAEPVKPAATPGTTGAKGGGEEEEEPRLKYAKLTGSLANVYRNGDSMSSFAVAGDKMVLGTHDGNVNVLSLPDLQSVRTYHAHSATITSISVSPVTPRPPQQQAAVLNTLSNHMYIATSSLDGHVCVSSLTDPKDAQLRNFGRPIQAVALSPDYRRDRTYLTGGRAGQLILTVGGKAGVTTSANTSSAAAAATGFLGAFGLGGDRGKDHVLHEGEGSISTIKWSLSGKWVAWANEEGIKIMRSHLELGPEDSEDTWKRIAHAARPKEKDWKEMVGVWRADCQWVDEVKVEQDEVRWDDGQGHAVLNGTSTAKEKKEVGARTKEKKAEKLLVGWGGTAWILHVVEGSSTTTTLQVNANSQANGGKKVVGTADITHLFHFRDCVVSGVSLYTPSLLAILAYRTLDEDDRPIQQPPLAKGKKGRQRRHQTRLSPQLRLVDIKTGTEEEISELNISRFETLGSGLLARDAVYLATTSDIQNDTRKGRI